MTRLIDVDVLDEAMYHKSFETDDGRQKWHSGLWIRYKIYEEACREAPTVDAEPVRHGKWNDIDSQMYTWKVRCNQCGHERSMMSTQGRYPKYCENCGARMDGDEHGTD